MLQGPLAFFLKKKNSGRENPSDAAGIPNRPALNDDYIATPPLGIVQENPIGGRAGMVPPFLRKGGERGRDRKQRFPRRGNRLRFYRTIARGGIVTYRGIEGSGPGKFQRRGAYV